jgi:hypothetical protein
MCRAVVPALPDAPPLHDARRPRWQEAYGELVRTKGALEAAQ